MILAPGTFLRVGLLLLVGVVLQLSAVAGLQVAGAHADLVVLVVAAIAYYAGSVSGTATGFAAGVLLDVAAGGTMGASSLVLSAVGYAVGRVRELRDPSNALFPIPLAAAATAGWVTAFAAVSFMLDVGASVSALVFRDMIVTSLVGAVLALPVFTLCRRLLRPALAVDPLDTRRRGRAPRDAGPIGLRGLEV